jgi:hypothetical protein
MKRFVIGTGALAGIVSSVGCSSTVQDPAKELGTNPDRLPVAAIDRQPMAASEGNAPVAPGLASPDLKAQGCGSLDDFGVGNGSMACFHYTCTDPCSWYCCSITTASCGWTWNSNCS